MKRLILLALFFLAMLTGSVNAFAEAEGSAKLDQVIQGQNQILAKLDEIKAELAIVKVRASQK